MARRKRKESGLDLLIAAPWQVSAVLAFMTLAGVLWFLPVWADGRHFLNPIMVALKPFGYFLSGVFGLIAGANYFRQRKVASSCQGVPSSPHTEQSADSVSPPISGILVDKVGEAWETSLNQSRSWQSAPKPTEWSITLLKQIEWKRFEELCASYFRELGLRVETIRCGADGGVDAKLFRGDAPEPEFILQCKAWNYRSVGVKPVRELLGVMTHQKVHRGIFMTTNDYTKEAVEFARDNPVFLIDGENFLGMIAKLTPEKQQRLLSIATEGDYLTPSCPSCGIKMVMRKGGSGDFWGCPGFPRCKQTFVMRSSP